MRSPFSVCECWWGIECDRTFSDVSAGGVLSAIALFGMSVLVGVGVRSLFSVCQCWWGIECDRSFCDVSAGGDVSAFALFRMSVLMGY
ncbi:hypothetical protein [Aerosakkonema funiforme]|uniref:hypothetical protein n=1 Tax=Aerosakkonema funiforme TaxID=1246630 RepID=UPI0035B718D0